MRKISTSNCARWLERYVKVTLWKRRWNGFGGYEKEIEKMHERDWNTKFLKRNSINVERRPHISGSAFMLKY